MFPSVQGANARIASGKSHFSPERGYRPDPPPRDKTKGFLRRNMIVISGRRR
jgi:hypothetical protein